MDAMAVILKAPQNLTLARLEIAAPAAGDVVVEIDYSGISTGTERLLWSGRMPTFPGMGYPLVPGYESVGRVSAADPDTGFVVGEHVFVPGANCFGAVRGLFGGAASRVVVAGSRVVRIRENVGERGVLLALAATAYHAVVERPPELIIGHGVLGRLVARIVMAIGAPTPVVWELNPARLRGGTGYTVVYPATDSRRDYGAICDVSGDPAIIDSLVMRLAPSGEIVLAGFYPEPLSFSFAPAFMREARIRVAAQWQKADLEAVKRLIENGTLSLDRLITHRQPATRALDAYQTAFGDPDCLKMILDWRTSS